MAWAVRSGSNSRERGQLTAPEPGARLAERVSRPVWEAFEDNCEFMAFELTGQIAHRRLWRDPGARKDGKDEWIIALDGKATRGAWTDDNDKVAVFSVMLRHEMVTIAQLTGLGLGAVKIPAGEPGISGHDYIARQSATTGDLGMALRPV